MGTGNNDDYSSDTYPAGTNNPLRPADSIQVQASTNGMTDAQFVAWMQSPQPVGPVGSEKMVTKTVTQAGIANTVIPGEWNDYGDIGVAAKHQVISVHTGLDAFDSRSDLLGLKLSFQRNVKGASTGMIIDITPEAVPSSQILLTVLLSRTHKATSSSKASPRLSRALSSSSEVGNSGRPREPTPASQCAVPSASFQ